MNVSKINDWFQSREDASPDQFLEFLASQKDCPYGIAELKACAQAVFFEPGNIGGDSSFR